MWAARGTVEFQPSRQRLLPPVGRLHLGRQQSPRRPSPDHQSRPRGEPAARPTSSTREGGLNDPQQKVRSGGVALHGEIGLNDWLKFRTITAYRKDTSATPIDFDATPAVDRRRSGHLQEPSVQPGIPAGRGQGAPAGRRRLLLSERQGVRHLRRPAVHAAAGLHRFDPRRCRYEDLGRVRGLYL